jgi:uncharacterized protein (DUF1684 family)
LAALFLSLALPAGAAAKDAASSGDSLSGPYLRARALKDSLLRSDPDSPLPAPLRAAFAGLAYFAPDPHYRLVGDLSAYGRRQQIWVPTTNNGPPLPLEKFGRLQAQFQGKVFWLEVYRSPESGQLEVFFKDSTNGLQTYGGGRYVPLAELGGGQYLLDFNMSYNPYCAYNATYVCPLPPPQNQLVIPIMAGEKAYGPDLAH